MAIKTLDLAFQYLDPLTSSLREIDIYIPIEQSIPQSVLQEITRVRDSYLKDSRNTTSNEVYRQTVFSVALIGVLDLINGNDCVGEATEIVSKNNLLKVFKKKWGNTIYPEVMMNAWDDYVESRATPKPYYLDKENYEDMYYTIMHVAYHYING